MRRVTAIWRWRSHISTALLTSPLPLREGPGEGLLRHAGLGPLRDPTVPQMTRAPPLPRPLPQGEGEKCADLRQPCRFPRRSPLSRRAGFG